MLKRVAEPAKIRDNKKHEENKYINLINDIIVTNFEQKVLLNVHGATDNNLLKEQNVKIWNGNASREFLDSRGLFHYQEGDLGPVYGHQWRHFNATYDTCKSDYSNKGVDQLKNIIEQLKDPIILMMF